MAELVDARALGVRSQEEYRFKSDHPHQRRTGALTSVEMIGTFYPSHIKNTLDAAAINVRREKSARRGKEKSLTDDQDPRLITRAVHPR